MDDIENVLSLYRPHSQICCLNRDGALNQPHPDLVQVMRSAITWSHLTDGAFDPTIQPLWKLYAQGGVPDPGRLQAARQLVDWRKVEVDNHRVRQILLKQGAKGVDATSGATITSEAILNATLKALAKGQK